MRKRVVIAFMVVAMGAIVIFGDGLAARFFPHATFARLNGYPLPAGSQIVRFESRYCDNLFKKCYYWMIDLPVGVELKVPTGATTSIEFDAWKEYRSEILKVLDPSVNGDDVPDGWKWERKEGRSQIMFRHKNGTRVYYELSTL